MVRLGWSIAETKEAHPKMCLLGVPTRKNVTWLRYVRSYVIANGIPYEFARIYSQKFSTDFAHSKSNGETVIQLVYAAEDIVTSFPTTPVFTITSSKIPRPEH